MSNPSFQALGLSSEILRIIEKKGFETPSPIQELAIPLVLDDKHDVIAQAQTGTGKTAAFAIPLLEKLKARGFVQALVMVPTRELAIQVAEEINSLRVDKKLEVLAIYGGQSMQEQLRRLKKGVDIVVATPGRLIDHMERRSINLGRLSYVVLDEADEMLRMGFIEDIESILEACPEKRRTLLFSATMPKPILAITDKYMRDKQVISVKKDAQTTHLTEQIYFEVRRNDRFEALAQVIEAEPDFYGVVFCRTKMDVDDLTKQLLTRGYAVEALHGDVSQSTREARLKKFKARKTKILIATDVAARGIDVNDLTHVVNYSLPHNAETYVHRIGRTGRAGKEGVAISFIGPSEYRDLAQIMRTIKAEIRKGQLPKAHDILCNKVARTQIALDKIMQAGVAKQYYDLAEQMIAQQDAKKVLAAFLQHNFQLQGPAVDFSSNEHKIRKEHARGDRQRKGSSRAQRERPKGFASREGRSRKFPTRNKAK